jgi:hypothetical protein
VLVDPDRQVFLSQRSLPAVVRISGTVKPSLSTFPIALLEAPRKAVVWHDGWVIAVGWRQTWRFTAYCVVRPP